MGNVMRGGNGAGIAVDDAGTVYAVENNVGALRRRTADGVVSVLLSPESFVAGMDIEMGPDGFLYVADGGGPTNDGSGNVFRVDPDTGFLSVFINGVANPSGLAFDEANGHLLVASFNNQTIDRFTLDGSFVETLTQQGPLPFPPFDIEMGPDGKV